MERASGGEKVIRVIAGMVVASSIAPMPTPDEAGQRQGRGNKAPCILLAEDNEALRALLAEHLRAVGYRVVEVRDGGALLEYIVAAGPSPPDPRPDLIVSDIRMPRLSGFDAAISLSRAGHALPLVFITAFSSPELVRFAKDLGAAAVLNKPFDLGDLVDAVSGALGRKRLYARKRD
jgi:CheY-like chemotaxis protein